MMKFFILISSCYLIYLEWKFQTPLDNKICFMELNNKKKIITFNKEIKKLSKFIKDGDSSILPHITSVSVQNKSSLLLLFVI